MNHEVTVSCSPSEGGSTCDVRVGNDPRATTHIVTVSAEALQRYDPGATDPVRLVAASFHFLLQRESRESILGSFELPVIERYFPGFGSEIRRELAD